MPEHVISFERVSASTSYEVVPTIEPYLTPASIAYTVVHLQYLPVKNRS
jgi:hypothetical protein